MPIFAVLKSAFLFTVFISFFGSASCSKENLKKFGQDHEKYKVSIKHNKETYETLYSIEKNACQISFVTFNQESINSHILFIKRRCSLPFSDQLSIIDHLLSAFISKEKNLRRLKTLYWGKIDSPDLQIKLIRGSNKQQVWKKIKTRKNLIKDNNFLKEFIKQTGVFDGLKNLFKKHGITIEEDSLENVMMGKIDKLSWLKTEKEFLALMKLNFEEQVIYTATVWFEISYNP